MNGLEELRPFTLLGMSLSIPALPALALEKANAILAGTVLSWDQGMEPATIVDRPVAYDPRAAGKLPIGADRALRRRPADRARLAGRRFHPFGCVVGGRWE